MIVAGTLGLGLTVVLRRAQLVRRGRFAPLARRGR
jgi:hypothetical protein